jgi:hypothetical protein
LRMKDNNAVGEIGLLKKPKKFSRAFLSFTSVVAIN